MVLLSSGEGERWNPLEISVKRARSGVSRGAIGVGFFLILIPLDYAVKISFKRKLVVFMTSSRCIFWFRNDLRVSDNPALSAAAQMGEVLPVFVLPDAENTLGAASKWWLYHALNDLNEHLGNRLILFRGDAAKTICDLAEEQDVSAVFWNRCYEPIPIVQERSITRNLEQRGIEASSFNGSALWEPWEVLKGDGSPYKVFTPFFRRGCLSRPLPDEPAGEISTIKLSEVVESATSVSLEEMNLLPSVGWDSGLRERWDVSEAGAHRALNEFLENKLSGYSNGRDFPSRYASSNLSPYISWGLISVHRIYERLSQKMQKSEDELYDDTFLSQLGWRGFAQSLLYHFPDLPEENMQRKFDSFPWIDDESNFDAWKMGQTGFPFVDAAMRELWETGFMHNRLRMVAGSFLVKNLLIDWRRGRDWFWDCLVDADLANNSMGWQWVSGCGVDAAPYFRVFNPVTQGRKFDSDGTYTCRYVPELKKLPLKYLFNPWEAPAAVLEEAEVVLGKDYPEPIVDLAESRNRALEAYSMIRGLGK